MKRAKKVEAKVWGVVEESGLVIEMRWRREDARRYVEDYATEDYPLRVAHLTEPSPLTAKERAELRKLRRVAKQAKAALRTAVDQFRLCDPESERAKGLTEPTPPAPLQREKDRVVREARKFLKKHGDHCADCDVQRNTPTSMSGCNCDGDTSDLERAVAALEKEKGR